MTQKVIWHQNMVQYFLLLQVITNEKTLKLKQVNRLPALPRFSPQKHVPTTLVGIPVVIYTLVVPSPGARVTVAVSLNRDLVSRVSAWCDHWGMKLNVSKMKTMIVSRSHTMHPQSPSLAIDDTVLKEFEDLDILGVIFDSKLTFEKYLRSVSRAASQRLCILMKSWQVFHYRLLIGRCFWVFVLPVFEYCSAVWCSAADTPLLLDCVVSGAYFLAGRVLNCDLSHRRSVAVLCMLYKIRCNPMHQLCGTLPVPYVPVRVTRGALIAHRYTYAPPRCRTSQ